MNSCRLAFNKHEIPYFLILTMYVSQNLILTEKRRIAISIRGEVENECESQRGQNRNKEI